MSLAPAPVSVRVEGPRIQFEPGTIRLRITVEPDARNRGLWILLYVDGFESATSSSFEQLEGARAAKTRWRNYRDMSAGVYNIYAVLERNDGSRTEARDSLQILSRGF